MTSAEGGAAPGVVTERRPRRLRWWLWRALLACVGAALLVQALEHTVWDHDPHRRASNVVEFALEAPDDELILEWRHPRYREDMTVEVQLFDLDVTGPSGESAPVELHYGAYVRSEGDRRLSSEHLSVVEIEPGTEHLSAVQRVWGYGSGPLARDHAIYGRLRLVDEAASIRGKVVVRASPNDTLSHPSPFGFERPRWPFTRGDRLELRIVDTLPDDVG